MAYKVIILYQLYMPSYFLGTFTEYPYLGIFEKVCPIRSDEGCSLCFNCNFIIDDKNLAGTVLIFNFVWP